LPSIATTEAAAVGQCEHGGVGLLGPAHRARLHDPVVLLEQRRREAMFGEASSASSASRTEASLASVATGAG
jgi:hypothetical protein